MSPTNTTVEEESKSVLNGIVAEISKVLRPFLNLLAQDLPQATQSIELTIILDTNLSKQTVQLVKCDGRLLPNNEPISELLRR